MNPVNPRLGSIALAPGMCRFNAGTFLLIGVINTPLFLCTLRVPKVKST